MKFVLATSLLLSAVAATHVHVRQNQTPNQRPDQKPLTDAPKTTQPFLEQAVPIWEQCYWEDSEDFCDEDLECVVWSEDYGMCMPAALDEGTLCAQYFGGDDVAWFQPCEEGLECVLVNDQDYACSVPEAQVLRKNKHKKSPHSKKSVKKAHKKSHHKKAKKEEGDKPTPGWTPRDQ